MTQAAADCPAVPSPHTASLIGIFGGTFDPVHLGHLRLAQEAAEDIRLDRVLWIPAGQPPHRGTPQVTSQQRLDMVRLATADNPRFVVDPAEVHSSAPSYTIHTLERLRGIYGTGQPLVLLLGADAFAALHTWHRWQEILEITHLAIAHRPGFPIAADNLHTALANEFRTRRLDNPTELAAQPGGRLVTFAMTQLAISATQIRKLLNNHGNPRYLLPDSVLDYIQTHHLYRTA